MMRSAPAAARRGIHASAPRAGGDYECARDSISRTLVRGLPRGIETFAKLRILTTFIAMVFVSSYAVNGGSRIVLSPCFVRFAREVYVHSARQATKQARRIRRDLCVSIFCYCDSNNSCCA